MAQIGQVVWLKTFTTPSSPQFGDLFNQVLRVDGNKNVTVMANFYSDVILSGTDTIKHVGPNFEDKTLLARYTSNGELLWKKALQKRGQVVDTVFGPTCRLAVDPLGNVVVAGILRVDTLDLGNNNVVARSCNSCFEIFVAKYGNNGDVVWANTLRATQGGSLHLAGVDCDAAGNIFLGGNTGSNGIVYKSQETLGITPSQQFVLKLDANGDAIWINTLVSSSPIAQSKMLRAGQDGSVYISGDFDGTFLEFGNDVFVFGISTENAYLEKINPNGTPAWARSVSANDIDLLDMSIAANGRAYIAADAVNNSFVDGQLLLVSGSPFNAYLLELDSANNNVLLQVNYDEELIFPIFTAVARPDGEKIYTGGIYAFDLLVGSTTLNASGIVDALLVEVSNDTNAITATPAGFGGTKIEAIENYNYGSAIGLDSDGYLYVIGYNDQNGKFGPFNLPKGGLFLAKLKTSSVGTHQPNTLLAQVNPNPNNGRFQIQLPEGTATAHCTIADMMGRMVFAQQLDATTSILQLDVPAGCYALALQARNGIYREKVIVQR
jgi:hypothetical protein